MIELTDLGRVSFESRDLCIFYLMIQIYRNSDHKHFSIWQICHILSSHGLSESEFFLFWGFVSVELRRARVESLALWDILVSFLFYHVGGSF